MFKKIFLLISVLFAASSFAKLPISGVLSDDEAKEIMCGDRAIVDHMREMFVLINGLVSSVETLNVSPKDVTGEAKEKTIQEVQRLRVHLSSVFNLTPSKILAIDEENPQNAKLIFQEYLHKMMGITLELEKNLRESPETPEGLRTQRKKIYDNINEIYQTVAKAHSLYRD